MWETRRDEGGRVCGGKIGKALIMKTAVLPDALVII